MFLIVLSTGSIGQKIDVNRISSSLLLKGNEVTAYRDPLPFYQKGIFYLYFTLTEIESNGKIFMYTAFTKSKDLKIWSSIKKISPRDQLLDFSSPGSIIRYKDEWIMCLQTYPRPEYTVSGMPKFGDETARLFIRRSKDLEHWSIPELMNVKGDEVNKKEMGRMIDPFILKDANEKEKWWVFYKQNCASRSWTNDLQHWHYEGHMAAGENVCIIRQNNEYVMFHSPENGIGVKRSSDLQHWVDDQKLILLGQQNWDWAKGRITAGYVLDLDEKETNGKRYLLFFHGSGPKTEKEGDFDKNASIGFAWSRDLKNWEWK